MRRTGQNLVGRAGKSFSVKNDFILRSAHIDVAGVHSDGVHMAAHHI